MIYRNATIEDIKKIQKLQEKYHISTIKEEDKKDGFVTTLFTYDQFKSLIEKENGLQIAVDGDEVVAYAMAASWDYWKEWPLFEYMIEHLEEDKYLSQVINTKNSYQYGPICIEKKYRGTDVLLNLFEYSRRQMMDKYDIMITFINHINPRSFAAHTNKLGMELIKNFEFNGNNYYELGYDTSIRVKGSNI